MSKKIIFLLPFLFGIGCFCDETLEHYNILEINIQVTDLNFNRPDKDGQITTDTLALDVFFTSEFIAQNANFSNLFMTKAYAFQCPDSGQQGLEDDLIDLVISSNKPFNDFPANTPLNGIISVFNESTVDELISKFSSWPYSHLGIFLTFKEKPVQVEQQFKIKIIFESGRELEQETDVIFWN